MAPDAPAGQRRNDRRRTGPLLTDPRAIGWPLLTLLAAVYSLDVVLGLGALGAGPDTGRSRLASVMVGAITIAVLGAVLLAGRAVWLRQGMARRHPSLMVLTVLVGAQLGLWLGERGVVGAGLAEPVGDTVLGRSVFLTGVACATMVVLNTLLDHRSTVSTLRITSQALQETVTAGRRALAREREEVHDRIGHLLRDTLRVPVDGVASFTSEQLRELADRVLRPLSHMLVTAAPGFRPVEPPRPVSQRWREILRALSVEPLLRPWLLAVALLLLTARQTVESPPPDILERLQAAEATGLAVTVSWVSLREASLMLAAVALATWLSVAQVERALSRWRAGWSLSRRWALTGAGLVVAGLAAPALVRLLHLLPGFGELPPAGLGELASYLVPLVLATLAVSLVRAVELTLSSGRAELARHRDALAREAARVNAQLVHERRTIARGLHGSVQAAVNAGSLAIDRAARDGAVAPAVLEGVADNIRRAIDELRAGTESGAALHEQLAGVKGVWSGVCEVVFDVDPGLTPRLDADPVCSGLLIDVVREACANAVMHGGATSAVVTVRPADGAQIEVTVEDSGATRHPMRGRGLGSEILEASCTFWALDLREDGATLTAVLPLT